MSGELQGRICLVFYLPSADAAQTLPKEQSVAKPSPDQLQVNPTARGFFSCTEPPLLCTSAWWTARTFLFFLLLLTFLREKIHPTTKKNIFFLKVLGSPQSRDRATLLCSPLTECQSLSVFFWAAALPGLSFSSCVFLPFLFFPPLFSQ